MKSQSTWSTSVTCWLVFWIKNFFLVFFSNSIIPLDAVLSPTPTNPYLTPLNMSVLSNSISDAASNVLAEARALDSIMRAALVPGQDANATMRSLSKRLVSKIQLWHLYLRQNPLGTIIHGAARKKGAS